MSNDQSGRNNRGFNVAQIEDPNSSSYQNTFPAVDGVSLKSADFPALFVAAESAAAAAQRRQRRLLRSELLLLVSASTASSLEAVFPSSVSPLAPAGAALLIMVAFVTRFARRFLRFDSVWFDGRAVAETVKTAAWRYAMRAEPFDAETATADATFIQRLRGILQTRPAFQRELHRLPVGQHQLTPWMRQARLLPLEQRRCIYLKHRVDEQATWYAIKARANRRSASLWFWTSLGAEALAIGFAVARILSLIGAVNLVSLAAAITAAATAWSQFGRHDELAKSYGVTAQELTLARPAIESADSDEALAQAVAEVEAAISQEHSMWIVKRG